MGDNAQVIIQQQYLMEQHAQKLAIKKMQESNITEFYQQGRSKMPGQSS